MLALTAVHQLTRHLKSGVTTIRDCAARRPGHVLGPRGDPSRLLPGPRLQLAGRAITHSRGHIHWPAASPTPPTRSAARSACSSPRARTSSRSSRRRRHEGRHSVPGFVHHRRAAGGGGGGARPGAAHRRARPGNPIDRELRRCRHRRHRPRRVPGARRDRRHGRAGAPTGLPKLDQRVAEKLAASRPTSI